MNNNNGKVEKGHALAYLIWDANSLEELDHLRDVFSSCFRIRKEQFKVTDRVMRRDGLRVGFTLIGGSLVDLKER